MKFLKLLAALLCAQVLIANADEKAKDATKETEKPNKPSLTYYYFDG